jgi:putative DNA primase/helicase
MFRVPVWATVMSAMMESFKPPEGIKKIIIYGDCDGNYTGQKSAYTLANRLVRDGYIVDVELPEVEGDWLDVAVRKEHQYGD